MKHPFKIILGLVLIAVLSLNFIFNVHAAKVVVDTVNTSKSLDGNIQYLDEKITTTKYNSSNTFTSTVQSLTLNAKTPGAHIVTWSTTASKYNTSLVTLDKIAEDYEKNHPGWIVVGGINAEGYWSGNGYNEISNTFVQDYQLMRTSVSSEAFKELIGFREDNSYFIKRVPEFSTNLMATLKLENGSLFDTLEVEYLNTLPEDEGLALYTPENTSDVDVSSYYVVSGSINLYRRTTFNIEGAYSLSDTPNGIYLDGSINKDSEVTSIKKNAYAFYFVTQSLDIYNKICESSKVSCQYSFLDEFKNAESVTGYMFKLIENGHVITPDDFEDNSADYNNGYTVSDDSFYYHDHTYMTGNKARSAIGFKEDGSIVLLNAVSGTTGPSQYELSNILESYGCSNAYQFDGGGSVTMIVRNENGGFDFMNPSFADGHPRSISTGIFFVVKSDEIEVSDLDKESVIFTNNNVDNTNIVVKCNNKTYEMTDNVLEIDDLKPNTTYSYTISYDTLSYLDGKAIFHLTTGERTFTTADFEAPWVGISFDEITKTTVKITLSNDRLKQIIVHVGEEEFSLDDNTTSFTARYLSPDTLYEVYAEYVMIDEDTGIKYNLKTTNFEVQTLKYEMPEIKKFNFKKDTDGVLTFDYEISDPDSRIKSILLIYDTCADEIDSLIGTIKTEKLTISTDVYLEIEYLDSSEMSVKLDSNPYYYLVKEVEKTSGCGNNNAFIFLSFCSLFSIAWMLKKRK